ncbi:hypothetical protein CRUP_007945 [Coryphaenoides rupestris]|nr:hypothetical protein CRUP_007945 [Coryphaenoides rupestris]
MSFLSLKEIRFNSVTELCAEVLEGKTHLGMRHCPHDRDPRPPSTIWEFRDDGTIYHPHSDMCVTTYRTAEGRADAQMRRCVPGDRHQYWKYEWCRAKKYDYRSLPTTSVVIAFYNEAWSTLLRTVHSVLETCPAILLREVILVDDFSDRGYLKHQLEEYMSKLERCASHPHQQAGGAGARPAHRRHPTPRGTVLTFLDCHCECVPGWIRTTPGEVRG